MFLVSSSIGGFKFKSGFWEVFAVNVNGVREGRKKRLDTLKIF